MKFACRMGADDRNGSKSLATEHCWPLRLTRKNVENETLMDFMILMGLVKRKKSGRLPVFAVDCAKRWRVLVWNKLCLLCLEVPEPLRPCIFPPVGISGFCCSPFSKAPRSEWPFGGRKHVTEYREGAFRYSRVTTPSVGGDRGSQYVFRLSNFWDFAACVPARRGRRSNPARAHLGIRDCLGRLIADGRSCS